MVHGWRMLVALILAVPAMGYAAGPPLGGGLGGLGGLGGVSRLPDGGILQGPLNTADRTAGAVAQGINPAVDSVRRDLVGRAITTNALARDEHGAAIVPNEVLAISPGPGSLAIARRLNFAVVRRDRLAALGILSITLRSPAGMSTADALAALRRADPPGVYDYAHIYNPSGGGPLAAGPVKGTLTKVGHIHVGMIDGGVQTNHPALTHDSVVTENVGGEGRSPPSQHGTAIASLLVGKDREFSGYLPGAKLYAADVFGGAPTGGSAADIARALNWLATKGVAVTNISLTGPPNALLEAAVKAFVTRGHVLVAAAGNDGPAAPLNYPAAYEGVVGVTSVDAAGHLQLDANSGAVQFAALGVDISAAILPSGYAKLTGTSYAAPAVAARFALLLDKPDSSAMRAALEQLLQEATPLPNRRFGYLPPPTSALTAAASR